MVFGCIKCVSPSREPKFKSCGKADPQLTEEPGKRGRLRATGAGQASPRSGSASAGQLDGWLDMWRRVVQCGRSQRNLQKGGSGRLANVRSSCHEAEAIGKTQEIEKIAAGPWLKNAIP